MDYSKIKVSVIVPVISEYDKISSCLEMVSKQTLDKEEIQVVLLVNTAESVDLSDYDSLTQKYPFAQAYYVDSDNLSQIRNIGIELSKGKYITYLYPGDSLSENTFCKAVRFFDKHYNEIDAVTYKLVPTLKGVRKKFSTTYNILKNDKVNDLNSEASYASLQFTNLFVKNKSDENVLFDITKNYIHSDMMYCLNVVSPKMKIGYISGCEYLYDTGMRTQINELADADVYETSLTKWEEIFDSFDGNIPKYVSTLFYGFVLNRFKTDTLLPYHLKGKGYDFNIERLRKMLSFIDDEVILSHPDSCQSTSYWFIDFKYNSDITADFSDKITISHGDKVLFEGDSISLKVIKFRFDGDELEVCGYISSPVLKYCEKPVLILRKQSNEIEYPELFESSFCYDESKIKNNQAWAFRCVIDTSENTSFSFKVKIGSERYGVELQTGEWVSFNKKIGRTEYVQGRKHCKMTDTRFVITNVDEKAEKKYRINELLRYLKVNIKVFVVRLLCLLIPFKNEVWLYHDCKAVGKDNGYQQFIHDFEKNDGVKRYYVVNGNIDSVKNMFTPEQRKNLIQFRSWKHKLMYLNASVIITAFIEKVNYLPFYDDVYMYYTDIFNAKVVYLQHGVLHAHLPWKYSYERLDLGYEVVSTEFEVDNLTENYSFPETALIRSKMPRYDFVDVNALPDSNRVLFAPSWRKYLITLAGDGSWIPDKDKFMQSGYYKKTQEFLSSPELKKILEDNDWYLDFKLHPIFKVYEDCFVIDNGRISTSSDYETADYKAVITDYSSFVFDFVYLGRAVIYFMPDYKEFKIGLNDYKALDIPFENGFGEFTEDPQSAIWALDKIIKNDGNPIPPFDTRTDGFFFNQEKDCREQIYRKLKTD